ncbi:ribonuclease H-like domain-containing protein, partial [Amylocystis lapponica]
VSTADDRSYLIDGFAGSGVSHTAQWILSLLLNVIDSIGRTRFSGACSDSTGNTKACRRELCKAIPTIINVPDPVHHTALPVKDICKLSYFQPVIQNLRCVLTSFSHSDNASNKLNEIRNMVDIGRGLQHIGNIRFATIIHAAISLRRCLPALRDAYADSGVALQGATHLFIMHSSSTLSFELHLGELIDVGIAFAKSIICLESSHSTLADTYVLWCSSAAWLYKLFCDPNCSLPPLVRRQVRGIFNFRWTEHFEDSDGRNCAPLASVYLHPRYIESSIFANPNPLLAPTQISAPHNPGEQPVKHPQVFARVGDFLGSMLISKVKNGAHPLLSDPAKKRRDLKARFKSQFCAYATRYYPFNIPLVDGQSPLDWWRNLEKNGQADIISILAIKLFSIMPNSMAEERTASTFTWLNRALRSRQHLDTIVAQTQIRQYY